MKTFRFVLSQELINYLERLEDEVITRHRVVSSLIYSNLNNPDILDSDLFIKYNDEYIKAVSSYEIAKENIASMFIPKCITQTKYSWVIDYLSHYFMIDVYDDRFINYTEEEYLDAISREI